MAGWQRHEGQAVALPQANIDTDQLIPARFMSIPRSEGYGDFLLHDLRRERGITIKAQSVSLEYRANDGETYYLNFIDTPGHVDFQYEVSRSLACCEGALLLVDAFQGVEAQTVVNAYAALEHDLVIVPVMNKIDLAHARPDEVAHQMEHTLSIEADEILKVSAKTGQGVREILEAVVAKIPPPTTEDIGTLRALIFDSWYDSYRGAVCMIRIKDGTVRKGDKVRLMATGAEYEVTELGVYAPFQKEVDHLGPGEVGYLAASVKSLQDAKVGDTITLAHKPAEKPLAGFQEVKPMVFCGIFPTDSDQYTELREALAADVAVSHNTPYTAENVVMQPGGKPTIGQQIHRSFLRSCANSLRPSVV